MTRLPRLLRAIQTLILAVVRTVTDPTWTRDFLASVYNYRPLSYSPRISKITLPEVLGGGTGLQVQLRNCMMQHGNMTAEEVITLGLLVRWSQPRGIFEFGTFNGNTTLQMAINAPMDCRIATLNLPLGHGETKLVSSAQDKLVHPRSAGSGQAYQNEAEKTRICELFGDSALFDFSPFHRSFDFVLVDAGHEYDYVKSDTENAFKLLPEKGGIIVWHDFPNAPGVCRWLEELAQTNRIFHVANTRLAFLLVGDLPRATGTAVYAHGGTRV